ncbi:MAG: NUDIX domain-containing protein [Granulosicoccus sp.]|nr:NUDIX domain-containing protein [Granulosicoccus sp.]
MRKRKHGANRQWQLEARTTLHDGFYRIDSVSFSHAQHDGESNLSLERELFVRGNVVGVLPYDPVNDTVVLVEQFRIGAMYQKPDPWMTEIIAGMIDTDESPADVAIREAREEAGVELSHVELISHYLASPGSSTEEVFVFHAETNLECIGGVHGLCEEDEDILACVVPAEKAIAMLDTREIRNALSIIALQWLKMKRGMSAG